MLLAKIKRNRFGNIGKYRIFEADRIVKQGDLQYKVSLSTFLKQNPLVTHWSEWVKEKSDTHIFCVKL